MWRRLFCENLRPDYVNLKDIGGPEQVMRHLPAWFDDYNDIAPHTGLGMPLLRMYRGASQG